MNKIFKGFVLAGAVLLLSANFAAAAEVLIPKDEDATITVGAAETYYNLYTGASAVMVNGNLTGDAYLAGGSVTSNGNVEEDLAVAGGTLLLNGATGGDLRAAGGTIVVNGSVGGDLLVAGGTITLTDKVSVGGDLLAAGGTLDISGPVAGDVNVRGDTIRINGKIAGNVFVEASKQLTFGPNAEVTGKVYYKGPKDAVVEQGAIVPNIEYTFVKSGNNANGAFKAIFTGAVLIKLLGWIIAALLLIKFFPVKTRTAIELAHNKPWASLGIGFLALIAAPIAVVVLFITLIGYYLAIVLLAVYITTLLISALVGALFAGHLIVKWLMKKPGPILDWQSAVIGVAVVTVLGFIPVIGWLVCAVLVLMAFGSLVQMLKRESVQQV